MPDERRTNILAGSKSVEDKVNNAVPAEEIAATVNREKLCSGYGEEPEGHAHCVALLVSYGAAYIIGATPFLYGGQYSTRPSREAGGRLSFPKMVSAVSFRPEEKDAPVG